MNKEETLSCDRLLNVMDGMGFIPLELNKKKVVFGDPDKGPFLTVPLQQGRCRVATLMNCHAQLPETEKQTIPFEDFRNHCLGHGVDPQSKIAEKDLKTVPILPKNIAHRTIDYNDLKTFFEENNWDLVGQRGSHFNYAPDMEGFRGSFAVIQHGSREAHMHLRQFKNVMGRLMRLNKEAEAQDEIIRLQRALIDKHTL